MLIEANEVPPDEEGLGPEDLEALCNYWAKCKSDA